MKTNKYIAVKAEMDGLAFEVACDTLEETLEDIIDENPVYESKYFKIYRLDEDVNLGSCMKKVLKSVKENFPFDEPTYNKKESKISYDDIEIYVVSESEIEDLLLDEAPQYEVIDEFASAVELRKYNDHYECHSQGNALKTPKGNIVQTQFQEVGEELMTDWLMKSDNNDEPLSMVYFQSVYQDQIQGLTKDEIIEMFNKTDWTNEWGLKPCPSAHPEHMMWWMTWMGEPKSREEAIRKLFEVSSPMQLASFYCIYKSFHSFNLAFVLASFARFDEEDNTEAIDDFYNHLTQIVDIKYDDSDFEEIFDKFRIFYLAGSNS